jgi:hypothetical protein
MERRLSPPIHSKVSMQNKKVDLKKKQQLFDDGDKPENITPNM